MQRVLILPVFIYKILDFVLILALFRTVALVTISLRYNKIRKMLKKKGGQSLLIQIKSLSLCITSAQI
jgi:hypothetical protein